MRIFEIENLLETPTAYLYHGACLANIAKIVDQNVLGRDMGKEAGSNKVSLSRSYRVAEQFREDECSSVGVLVLDYQKLRQRFKITPKNDMEFAMDIYKTHRSDEREELVHSVISPLSNYLVSINVDLESIEYELNRSKLDWTFRDNYANDHAAKKSLDRLKNNPLLNIYRPRNTDHI